MDSSLMIAALLIGVIQIILILSVVHISAKTDEIAEILRSINDKLAKNSDNVSNAPAEIRTSTPQKVRNCKGCGRDK